MQRSKLTAMDEIYNNIVDAMVENFSIDVEELGEDQAILNFQNSMVKHHKEHGTWDKASEFERPAHMMWAAAELYMGALINAGVWHD